MTEMVLTSNGFFTEGIRKQFLEQMEDDVEYYKVGIITTASIQKENNRFALKAKKDFLQMGFTQVGFIDIEYDNLQLLEQCQIIYINGGNPFYLLYQMKKSRTDIILRDFACRGNMIIGVSAGAVVLGPNIEIVHYFTPEMNSIKLRDFKALGLTNKIIFPHYDREDLFLNSEGKSIEDRLQEYESLHNCMITRLKNNQFLISEYLIE